MKKKKVEVEIPLSIYELLQDITQSSKWPFEEVVLQTIKAGLPPSLGKVPTEFGKDHLIASNGGLPEIRFMVLQTQCCGL